MGTTLVPPLASQDLTTTKFDVGGVPPPWGLSGLTTTRGGSGGERSPLTFTPTLTLPVKNERKNEG